MSLDLYEILEVDSSASTGDIKRAYRKLALRYHPDKVSELDREEAEIRFKNISHAYEILSDEVQRLNYDLYGSADGFPDAGMNGFSENPFGNRDLSAYGGEDFYNFFNNMGGMPRQGANSRRQQSRTEDAEVEVQVTLEDLYKGKTIKITSTRNIICHTCEGSGARKRAVPKTCAQCQGNGYVTKIKRVGPGLVSQFHVDCETCLGTGKTLRTKDRCKKCAGERVEEETKILEFEIAPGLKSGELVVLAGESDQYPGKKTGDVILTFHCDAHETFTRKGDDLYTKYRITLVEALSGFSSVIAQHLDGRAILISTPKGKVIRPGDFLRLSGEGMPVKNRSRWSFTGKKAGDLFVEINIEFPNDNWYLEKNDIVKLKNILPNELRPSKEKVKQEISPDSLPEPNIDYVADFTIVPESLLPTYEEQDSHDKHHDHENEDAGHTYYADPREQVPECATQ